ncbi:hypothetical protein H7F10_04340 [Acidithiobacillus sp. HP-6]|uniref:hypothetical protein n=1 Tax=unclassified Acidithiobacillus TaxID=2614800 RepID=UPI00187AD145|nr:MULTISPECIES: hypothetical protein [unclassified Acidithiobacillus]MBE7562199.1 hypothetical protein [Acidithiobacillus sp. HP-6]MBE7568924.1 hypothetical protein [Acidithiobacillus sp. HP-2]
MEDLLTNKTDPAESSAEVANPQNATPNKKPSFRERFAYPIMLLVGVVAAGGISFLVQSGTLSDLMAGGEHSRAAAVSGGPRSVPVVYINTGKIMADVIKSQVENGALTRHEAAEMGHVIGQTIQAVAANYARRGDLVLSRNVLAAPETNNVTAQVEKIVQARLAQDFGGAG